MFVTRHTQCILLGLISSLAIADDRPSVVVIMADDMGYSDIGCFGGEIHTPNLDALADNGLRFTQFYSENMCWVSRAALLTGVYHKTSLVNGAIHPRCQTLSEALRSSGYQTRMSGKWHLAGKKHQVFPVDRGFDEYYGILGGAASFYAPVHLTRNRKNVEAEAHSDPDYYITDAISQEAVRMIRKSDSDQPLFLSVAYTAAHWPLHARQEDIKRYRGRYSRGWDQLRTERLQRMKALGIVGADMRLSPRHHRIPDWESEKHKLWQERRMEVYAAQVTVMDQGIGTIISALKESGRFDNTLIFFTVDNGGCHVEYEANRKGDYLPALTRDGRPVRPGNLPHIMPGPEDTYQSYGYGWANASNTPWRYFKQFDHEGGIRTSMIAHWPSGISHPGTLVRSAQHLVDIMPTVLEVTQTKAEPQEIPYDGQSFAAEFRNEDNPGRTTFFFDHARGRAFRENNWKIVAAKNGRLGFSWELYDLSSDPLELHNLADARPNVLQKLAAQWKSESKRHAQQAGLE